MKPILKVGLIIGGYIAAFLIASVTIAIWIAMTSGPEARAASGMYAFGDALLFIAVFGVSALVPTGGALFFLRPYRRFWTVLSVMAVLFAITGSIAVGLFAIGREPTSSVAVWAVFSVPRILAAPLFALAFLICAVISPSRSHRSILLLATIFEAAVSGYGAFVWFTTRFFQ
jgi:hypothetical protein